MSEHVTVTLITLVVYQLLLLAIGLAYSRRVDDARAFFLGGQRLGPWVAGLSAATSSSSAWVLLGISGAGYAWGLSALWILPGAYLGFALNWLWVAPRLRRITGPEHVTLTDLLVGPERSGRPLLNRRLAALIILFSFLFYVGAQFQAAGQAFHSALGLEPTMALALGVTVIVLYTLLGGFLAVSVTDMLQGVVMLCAALILPVLALIAAGGFGGIISGLEAAGDPNLLSLTGPHTGLLGLGFVLGTLAIGTGNPGQPHVLNRFMALRDQTALRQAQVIAIVWGACLYGGMVLLGLAARALFAPELVANSEGVFFVAAESLLPAVMIGVMVAAVLSAIMSTADSQLLVCAAALSRDLPQQPRERPGVLGFRLAVVAVSLVAVLLTLALPRSIFDRVLFAWHAVGSALGPAVIVLLAGRRLRPEVLTWVMALGFGLTVLAHWTTKVPGQWTERLLPFLIALALAWWGSRPRAPA